MEDKEYEPDFYQIGKEAATKAYSSIDEEAKRVLKGRGMNSGAANAFWAGVASVMDPYKRMNESIGQISGLDDDQDVIDRYSKNR